MQFADSTRALRIDGSEVLLATQVITSTEQPVATAGPPLVDTPETGPASQGRLVLAEAGQDLDIGGNVQLFGTSGGGEAISVVHGDIMFDASFNLGGDTIILAGDAGSYFARLSGSFVTLTGDGVAVTIPVGTTGLTVEFDDAARMLRIDENSGQVMLGDQIVTTGGTPVTSGAQLAMPTFAEDVGIHSPEDAGAIEIRGLEFDSFAFG